MNHIRFPRWSKRVDKTKIHPDLVCVIDNALEYLEEIGHPFKVYSGLRTFKEQDRLFSQGRNSAGHIVTNAMGGQSMHNYGLAVDLAPYNLITEDPKDLWWPSPEQKKNNPWDALGVAIETASRMFGVDGLEFEWGGHWRFKDVPHCQIRTTLKELDAGLFPYCSRLSWLIDAHKAFLFDTAWINRRIQNMLNATGISVGAVDGVVGPRTIRGIFEFRRNQGMEREDDVVTKNLVEKLVIACY
jgi:peptidoglycan L-alanyl-D-glutamate endopeptidase CwlK